MPTALVIEDDQTSASVLAHVLERNGYRVLSTVDASEAEGFCDAYAVNVVISDIILRSPLSGTDVARRLRQSCPEIPSRSVSATPLEGWSEHDFANVEALLPGRVSFLMKPFTAEGLKRALEKLLASSYSGKEIQERVEVAKRFRKGAGT